MSPPSAPQSGVALSVVTIGGREFRIGAIYGPKSDRGTVKRRLDGFDNRLVKCSNITTGTWRFCWPSEWLRIAGEEIKE